MDTLSSKRLHRAEEKNTVEPNQGQGRVREERGNQSLGVQKTKMISLVDICMPQMPGMAVVHFWLCLCQDE